MPPKPKTRNRWNDVQTTIAAISIAVTLGLWNLFATPAKTVTAQVEDPGTVPPTEPPVASEPAGPAEAALPTALAHVKIMFTPGAPQVTQGPAAQQPQQQVQKKKKKGNNGGGGGGGGGGPVTVTHTS